MKILEGGRIKEATSDSWGGDSSVFGIVGLCRRGTGGSLSDSPELPVSANQGRKN